MRETRVEQRQIKVGVDVRDRRLDLCVRSMYDMRAHNKTYAHRYETTRMRISP